MRLSWDKVLLMQIIQLSDEFDLSHENFGTQTESKNSGQLLEYVCKK